MAVAEETKKPKRRATGLKLDLGCGQRVTEGFQGVDIAEGPGVEYLVDLFQYPWPFEDRSVREVFCSHLIEHIPHYRPEYGGVDGFWMFFNELYRICRKGAKLTFVCPYFKADRGFWDPSHTRYVSEINFYYLNPVWLKEQGLDHYPITANFEIITVDGMGVSDEIMNRNDELQNQARSWYWNIIQDIQVQLKAIK